MFQKVWNTWLRQIRRQFFWRGNLKYMITPVTVANFSGKKPKPSTCLASGVLHASLNFLRVKKWDKMFFISWDKMFLSREIKIFYLKLTFWENKKWDKIILSCEIKIFYLNLSAKWKVAAWQSQKQKSESLPQQWLKLIYVSPVWPGELQLLL